jgi:hypothetical protein
VDMNNCYGFLSAIIILGLISCYTLKKATNDNNHVARNLGRYHIDLDKIELESRSIDHTYIIQDYLNRLDKQGGKITIPPNYKFNLKKLKFPQKIELEYFAGSNMDLDAGYIKNTNEKVLFLANANEDGIVNEFRFSAAFHPGLIIDAKKEVGGQIPYLGKGQDMEDPVRASILIDDEGLTHFISQYQSYKDYNNPYSGVRMSMMYNEILLDIKYDFKKIKIQAGDLISTSDNQAQGHVISLKGNVLAVQWLKGIFKENQTLIFQASKVPFATVSKVELKVSPMTALSLSKKTGFFGVGIPNDNALYPFTVGGKIGIQGSRQHGQVMFKENSEPALVFSPSFEEKKLKGLELVLDGKSEWNRLVTRDIDSQKDVAHISAVKSHTSFTASYLFPSRASFNIEKIEKIAIGKFRVIFKNSFKTPDYQVFVSTNSSMEYGIYNNRAKESVEIHITKTGSVVLIDPIGEVSVLCIGGGF